MPLKITKASDPLTVENIIMMVYGEPGVGKTSSAFTAPNVLLIDTDRGAHRSGFRKDTVQVGSWEDIKSISAEDLEGYDVVAVDTAGRLLEFLSVFLVKSDYKNARSDGSLSLQGFGALKHSFASWCRSLRVAGKDLVFIAHEKEDRKGDDIVYRPDVQGSSQEELFKVADAVGRMHVRGKEKVLDFRPTSEWLGKDPGLGELTIPDFNENPSWLGDVIGQIKGRLNELSAEQKAAVDFISAIQARMSEVETADGLNEAWAEAREKHEEGAISKTQWIQIRKVVSDRAEQLGAKADAETKQFVIEEKKEEEKPKKASKKKAEKKEEESSSKDEPPEESGK